MNTDYQSLKEAIDVLPVISVHEHHRTDEDYREMTLESLLLGSYVGWANPYKLCAEMPPNIPDRQFFLDNVRANAYFIWLERGIRRIYDVGRITLDSWEPISRAISQAHAHSARWHIDIMRKFGRYERALEDSLITPFDDAGHPELFSPVFRINCFVLCHHVVMQDHNGRSPWQFGFHGGNFDDYLEFVAQVIAEKKAAGAVALKSALAYDRELDFTPRERAKASRAFGKHPSEVSEEETRCFQDFMYDYICTLAAGYELPFQNHTGLAQLHGSTPMKLLPMIHRHPQTRFVLFHGGYPWVHEIAGIAHNYPNAYPDLTWLPLISPTAAVQAIHEWLEVTPSARTICWGGDAFTGEEAVGAAIAFKHVLTAALSQKVADGYFDRDEALEVARRLCSENARAIYRLPNGK